MVEAPLELLEGCEADRLCEEDERTDPCPVAFGHNLCHSVAFQEALRIFLHGIVIPLAEIWAKPANPKVAGRSCSHSSIAPRRARHQAAPLSRRKSSSVYIYTSFWQGTKARSERAVAALELHKEERQCL